MKIIFRYKGKTQSCMQNVVQMWSKLRIKQLKGFLEYFFGEVQLDTVNKWKISNDRVRKIAARIVDMRKDPTVFTCNEKKENGKLTCLNWAKESFGNMHVSMSK